MTYGSYPARRSVAERVRTHFIRHLAQGSAEPSSVACVSAPPDLNSLETLIDVAFWTSLRREEGYVPIISLALVAPDATPSALRFASPLALKPATLAKVAPAVERPGIHLGISDLGGGLSVWGATRVLPQFCLV